MSPSKDILLKIAAKVEANKRLTPSEVETLSAFSTEHPETPILTILKNLALPLSILLGISIAVFPEYFEDLVDQIPPWTNMQPRLLAGVNYVWDIISDPVDSPNILFHLPNIVLYSFGILGIKKLFDAINKETWLDKVLAAKEKLQRSINNGSLGLDLEKGHSILFVGKGDFIGMQFVLNRFGSLAVTIAEAKPDYTNIWNYYDANAYEDLKAVIERVGGKDTGEYIFFPVKDDQIFLPGPNAYDLSPHKIDILCQNIRKIEKELGWSAKRIIIIGDKYHHSYVRSENEKTVVKNSEDVISLQSIVLKYKNVTILDPTDIVLAKILEIAKGRTIAFRATREGLVEYKARFYERLKDMGYPPKAPRQGILTIGYDLFEDQTEQQTLAHKIDDYYPVVLSKGVRDALIRNGHKQHQFLYVPDLVISYLGQLAEEQ